MEQAHYKLADLPASNVLIYQDEHSDTWVAHCLEMDLVEEGETKIEAIQNLLQVVIYELEECMQDGLNPFHVAPEAYWSQWLKAKPFYLTNELKKESQIPPHFVIREIPSHDRQNSYPAT